MSASLAVVVGSALGGLARYWLAVAMAVLTGPRLPWGTLLINIVGSFVIGWFATRTGGGGRWVVAPEVRVLVMAGFCGGFTTFSSFSLQSLELLQAREFGWAAAYIAGSAALCLVAVWVGSELGR